MNFTLGQRISTNVFLDNFDSATAPNLPAGWTTSASDSEAPWVTTATNSDTPPNSAFAADLTTSGIAYLVSPPISILTSNAQLTFRQNYRLESITTTHRHSPNTTTYYDGGVLEIQIGPSGFADIISAGGSFVTGGYAGSLYSSSGNPLAGRQAWSGNSDGWITTTVNLPATAAGQVIQLRWDLGTDTGNAATVTGWYIDSVSVQDGYYTCCNDNGLLPATLNAAGINVTGGIFHSCSDGHRGQLRFGIQKQADRPCVDTVAIVSDNRHRGHHHLARQHSRASCAFLQGGVQLISAVKAVAADSIA